MKKILTLTVLTVASLLAISCGDTPKKTADKAIARLESSIKKANSADDLLKAIEAFDEETDKEGFELYNMMYKTPLSDAITTEERAQIDESLKTALTAFCDKEKQLSANGDGVWYLSILKIIESWDSEIRDIESDIVAMERDEASDILEDIEEFQGDLALDISCGGDWAIWFDHYSLKLSPLTSTQDAALEKKVDSIFDTLKTKLSKRMESLTGSSSLSTISDDEDEDYDDEDEDY